MAPVIARAVALETSTRTPSVAVRRGDELREVRLESERPHASDLLPALDGLLRELELAPHELDAVLVGTGPGSYTGLRVGVATALGLALGSDAALFALPSTEALVWNECAPGGEAAVLLDARAGELYFAHHRRTPDGIEAVYAPCVTTRDELRARLSPDLALLADDDAVRAAELTNDEVGSIRAAFPSASAVLELGCLRLQREGPHAPAEVEPLYLRAFAARPRKR
jgi:tRNA threonylcarbamoyladenosine biosynthesis protein TsaB